MILRIFLQFVLWGPLLFAQQGIREASISRFPQLPDAVRQDLRTRGCTVQQPPYSPKLVNVIRGHFRDLHHTDWVVVCDVSKTAASMLLVYWEGNLSAPAVVHRSKLSNENCWTEITPVGKVFIMERYKAYGGPKPPPIDHQGINVSICDKASTVSYFYRNHWWTLTGSD